MISNIGQEKQIAVQTLCLGIQWHRYHVWLQRVRGSDLNSVMILSSSQLLLISKMVRCHNYDDAEARKVVIHSEAFDLTEGLYHECANTPGRFHRRDERV